MFPEQEYKESEQEYKEHDTTFLEHEALPSEKSIEDRIREKMMVWLQGSGKPVADLSSFSLTNSSSFSENFKKLTKEQQAAKIQETIRNKTTYGDTLNRLKQFTLEKLNKPEILKTNAEVQAAAAQVKSIASDPNATLHDLYPQIIVFCDVAIQKSQGSNNGNGWVAWVGWNKAEPQPQPLVAPIKELHDALMGENGEFKLGNFFSHWQSDAQMLSAQALKEDELEFEKQACKFTAEVFQESYAEASFQLDQTLERSQILKRNGQAVQLQTPSKSVSLSSVIAANYAVVKTQEIKAQKIKDENKRLLASAVEERLKQYMSEKTIACIGIISGWYKQIEETVNILESRVLINQKLNNGPGFFPAASLAPTAILTPEGQNFLSSEKNNLRLLRKVIYTLATNNNSTVDFILDKYLELLQSQKQYEFIYKLLSELKPGTQKLNDSFAVNNIPEKWGFLSTCYKAGSEYGGTLPFDKELSDLLSKAKAQRLDNAPAFPSSTQTSKHVAVVDDHRQRQRK